MTVAHRGTPYIHRENTLASVRSAVRGGADVVEVDVRPTRDGVPVLLHDATLQRLWGVRAAVADMTAEEVRRTTGGGVPTLAEALHEIYRAGRARALLDLTDPTHAAAAVAGVRAVGAGDRVYYCGGTAAMLAVRRLDPDAEIALTWATDRRPAPALLAAVRPRWLNLRFGLAGPATVRWARDRDLLVAVWTADLRRTMTRMLTAGADAITTNRLDVLQGVLARGGHRGGLTGSALAVGRSQGSGGPQQALPAV